MDPSSIPHFSPPAIIVQTITCQLIGVMLNWFLLGCIVVQFHHYVTLFPNDGWFLKTFIYTVVGIELVQAIMLTEYCTTTFAAGFGDYASLSQIKTIWFAVPFLTTLISWMVQMFLIRRLYILAQARLVALGLLTLSFVHAGAGFASAAFGNIVADLTKFQSDQRIIVAGTVWIVTGAAVDTFIAISLIYYLYRLKNGFRRTETILNKMILLTVETGSFTAVIQVAGTILFFAAEDKPYYYVLTYFLSKAYGINLLVIQNSRETTRSIMASPTACSTSRMNMPNFTQSRSQSSGIVPRSPSFFGPTPRHVDIMVTSETTFELKGNTNTSQGDKTSVFHIEEGDAKAF